MDFALGFLIGVLVGAAIALVVSILRGRAAIRHLRDGEGQLREAFSALASDALDANAKRLAEQAGSVLEGKKALIDQALKAVSDRLEQVRQVVQRTEVDRKQDAGRLTEAVAALSATTGELHKVLASSQRRGAWGERMAEDVLRLAGLQEKINYEKQSSQDADTGRPDFTFMLPNGLKANMDVKFPLERYKAYLDAETEEDRRAELGQLAAAVRGHVRAVAGRGYIDPKVPTVNYVLVFLPSEQILSLALSAQPDLMDEALRWKVILCSPLTLYAMLAVMRQAAENANVMRTADEVIDLLNQFYREWRKYNDELDKLGQRIDQAARQFETVRTTRSNMLERPLAKIEELRTTRGLPEPPQEEQG
jgi:DNA recombination protein RmuC